IHEQKAVIVTGVLITVVSNAVTSLENTVIRERERSSRREVPESTYAAEPIHDDRYFLVNGLFIADDCAGFGSKKILTAGDNTVRTKSESGAIGTGFHLLVEFGVTQPKPVHALTVIDRLIPENT